MKRTYCSLKAPAIAPQGYPVYILYFIFAKYNYYLLILPSISIHRFPKVRSVGDLQKPSTRSYEVRNKNEKLRHGLQFYFDKRQRDVWLGGLYALSTYRFVAAAMPLDSQLIPLASIILVYRNNPQAKSLNPKDPSFRLKNMRLDLYF